MFTISQVLAKKNVFVITSNSPPEEGGGLFAMAITRIKGLK